MLTPDDNYKQAAEKPQRTDGNPVIENRTDKVSRGKMRKLWIVIAALVLSAAGGLLWGLSYFKGVRLVFEHHAQVPEQETEYYYAEKGKSVKTTFALDPFLVNLADRGNVRFLKTSFQLGLAQKPDEKNVETAVAAMRDSIITLLSSKTSEQVLTPQGKDKLRKQIRSRVNAVSPEFEVVEVYIVDFVVQL